MCGIYPDAYIVTGRLVKSIVKRLKELSERKKKLKIKRSDNKIV